VGDDLPHYGAEKRNKGGPNGHARSNFLSCGDSAATNNVTEIEPLELSEFAHNRCVVKKDWNNVFVQFNCKQVLG